jgi:hypothetical protein
LLVVAFKQGFTMPSKTMTVMLSAALGSISAVTTVSALSAPNESIQDKDPVRWNLEDITVQARYLTSKKRLALPIKNH